MVGMVLGGLVLFFLFITFVVVSYGISKHNEIVRLDNAVAKRAGYVNSALQRRYDLIPNLVATVKAYAAHERGTFEAVAKARAAVGQFTVTPQMLANPEMLKKFQAAQGELSSALSRLMVVSERYPDLKANQNFLELQAQLEGTENRIKVERDNYNTAVEAFNNCIGQFPGNIFAGGRTEKPMFQLTTPDAQNAPQVKF
ncbi:MAG: LemA family protein [Patescibacteria group bacterium]|nr:LemA family protein [Patescibacteria group bacterium]MDE2438034.1 LemA family protein [Patescibacteria group bacterium]